MPVNEFHNSQALELKHSPRLNAAYTKMYPGLKEIITITDDTTQMRGIDKVIITQDSGIIRIEEKVRDLWFGDILLEYTSNDTTGTPGWMEKWLLCDYLFYAIMENPARLYYFYWPGPMGLKSLWDRDKFQWISNAGQGIDGFTKIAAPNPGYHTLSVGVPPQLLLDLVTPSGLIHI